MLSTKYAQVVSTLITLLILYKIREYLGEIPKCACYKGKEGKYDSIDRLRVITAVIMGIVIVSSVAMMFGQKPNSMMLVLFPVIVIVYLLYVYNVHDFRHNIASKCDECADKWPKYAMYAYALIYVIMLALVLMGGILIVTTMNINKSPETQVISLTLLFLIGLVAYSVMGGSINDITDFMVKHSLMDHQLMKLVGMEGFEGKEKEEEKEGKEGFSCGCSSGKCNKHENSL